MPTLKTISILLFVCCCCFMAEAQMRVVYPKDVKIDLGKKRSFSKRTKAERKEDRADRREQRKARRQARKEEVKDDATTAVTDRGDHKLDSIQDAAEGKVANAENEVHAEVKAVKGRLVSELTRMFPDIPLTDIREYSSIVFTDSAGLKNSLEGFVQPYYPPDSVSRTKVSTLTGALVQDMEPRIQEVMRKQGVLQELSGAGPDSGLMDLVEGGPKDPLQVLGTDEQLAAAMNNLQGPKESFMQVNGLRQSSKIAARQFLTRQYTDHFRGQEAVLDKAQKTVQLTRQKPSFRSILKQLLDQQNESVREKKLLQRFELGGYVQYFIGKPGYLDVAPTIGYQLTGKITLGAGGNYRFAFGEETAGVTNRSPQKAPGWRAFANYDIIGNVFLNNELERLYVPVSGQEPPVSQGVTGYLLGIGNEVNVRKKLKMTVLLQYNALYNSNTPYPRPWTLKVGFKL